MQVHIRLWSILLALAILAGLRCGTDRASYPDLPEFAVVPYEVSVEVSSSQQFAIFSEDDPPDVIWYVNGIEGGSPDVGMIDTTGLYIAPAVVAVTPVTVTAQAVLDPTDDESATVHLIKQPGSAYIEVAPGIRTAVVGDSVGLTCSVFGCPQGAVIWSLVRVAGLASEVGSIRGDGTYIAPMDPDGDFAVMVMARSSGCPGKAGIARVVVKKPLLFFVQTEDFTDSSGTGIDRNVTCEGGKGVTGLNAPGEWIRIPIEITAGGSYQARIWYASGDDDVLILTLTAEGCSEGGTSSEAIYSLDAGSGVGG